MFFSALHLVYITETRCSYSVDQEGRTASADPRPSCFSPAELRRARLPPCQSLILIKLVTVLMQVTNKAVKTMRYKSSRLIAGDLGNLRASFLFRARRHSPVLIPSCSGWKNPLHSTLLNAALCLAHVSGFSERCETFLHTVMMKCCKALKH